MDLEFLEFRNTVIKSLDKHGVDYKLFGGAVICTIDKNRQTVDLDIAIKANVECAERFIDALADCKFADRDFISMQVYGEGAEVGENLYSTAHIETDNPIWKGFHIDLCFNLGEYSYDTMPSKECLSDGMLIHMVPIEFIAKMKANIFPCPRPKDMEDIRLIAEHLGVDPGTGLPIEDKPKKKLGLFPADWFGGDK